MYGNVQLLSHVSGTKATRSTTSVPMPCHPFFRQLSIQHGCVSQPEPCIDGRTTHRPTNAPEHHPVKHSGHNPVQFCCRIFTWLAERWHSRSIGRQKPAPKTHGGPAISTEAEYSVMNEIASETPITGRRSLASPPGRSSKSMENRPWSCYGHSASLSSHCSSQSLHALTSQSIMHSHVPSPLGASQ